MYLRRLRTLHLRVKNFGLRINLRKEKRKTRMSKPEEILLPMFRMNYVPRYRLLRGSLTLFRKIMKSSAKTSVKVFYPKFKKMQSGSILLSRIYLSSLNWRSPKLHYPRNHSIFVNLSERSKKNFCREKNLLFQN